MIKLHTNVRYFRKIRGNMSYDFILEIKRTTYRVRSRKILIRLRKVKYHKTNGLICDKKKLIYIEFRSQLKRVIVTFHLTNVFISIIVTRLKFQVFCRELKHRVKERETRRVVNYWWYLSVL